MKPEQNPQRKTARSDGQRHEKREDAAGVTAVISISNMQSVFAQGTPTHTLKYPHLNVTLPLSCSKQWRSVFGTFVLCSVTVMDGKQAKWGLIYWEHARYC